MWSFITVTQLSLSSVEVAASKYFFPFLLQIWKMCFRLSFDSIETTVEFPKSIQPVGSLQQLCRNK